jgi:hypothetical protein
VTAGIEPGIGTTMAGMIAADAPCATMATGPDVVPVSSSAAATSSSGPSVATRSPRRPASMRLCECSTGFRRSLVQRRARLHRPALQRRSRARDWWWAGVHHRSFSISRRTRGIVLRPSRQNGSCNGEFHSSNHALGCANVGRAPSPVLALPSPCRGPGSNPALPGRGRFPNLYPSGAARKHPRRDSWRGCILQVQPTSV